MDNKKVELIEKAINNINKKENEFYFVVPKYEKPSASIYEIYFHATVVKKMGYKVNILVDTEKIKAPDWVDSELTDFKHLGMDKAKIQIGPEDVIVIPDIYSNVMEQVKNLPCVKVGLLQSIDYKMNALVPGTDWTSFNIDKVITTSLSMKEFIETFFGKNKYDIEHYDVGIPEYFNNKENTPKKPIISIVGRNPNEISKIVKLFYSRFPEYNWVTFDPMLTKSKPPKEMRRKDFAKRLKENFAAIWVDRISSWGTFPIECMRTGTIPIALKPDIIPEYLLDRDGEKVTMKKNSGIWLDNFYDIPLMIGNILIKFLDGDIDDELYDTMSKISNEFTQDKSEKQLTEIYSGIIEKRLKGLNESLEINNTENKENNTKEIND